MKNDKPKNSTYRPLADRGDSMKWYEFECMFCGHCQERCFINEQAMTLNFWNPVQCESCHKYSTPERKEMKGEDKKLAKEKRERMKKAVAERVGLFDSVATETVVKERQTILSPDRLYRYQLWREWNSGEGYALFIGLNPSTADETTDDNTIRKCVKYAKKWDYQALCMANLFAFRATEPEDMKSAKEPIGLDNDYHLLKLAEEASVIIVAWGANGIYLNRDQEVLELLRSVGKPICCLGLTASGIPRHPLYMRDDQELVSFF